MNVKEAQALTGGLGKPSKMPGRAYGIPAQECKLGAMLRKIKGSTCHGCYALKGRYVFPNVTAAQYRRLESIANPQWVDAMVTLINAQCASEPWFRWHDAGDLQSVDHLARIVDVVRRTPKVRHWLPTRELAMVQEYARENTLPKNLVIRVSATMIDGKATARWATTSTVHKAEKPIGKVCPAPKQGGKCGSCRNCWNPKVDNVSYHVH